MQGLRNENIYANDEVFHQNPPLLPKKLIGNTSRLINVLLTQEQNRQINSSAKESDLNEMEMNLISNVNENGTETNQQTTILIPQTNTIDEIVKIRGIILLFNTITLAYGILAYAGLSMPFFCILLFNSLIYMCVSSSLSTDIIQNEKIYIGLNFFIIISNAIIIFLGGFKIATTLQILLHAYMPICVFIITYLIYNIIIKCFSCFNFLKFSIASKNIQHYYMGFYLFLVNYIYSCDYGFKFDGYQRLWLYITGFNTYLLGSIILMMNIWKSRNTRSECVSTILGILLFTIMSCYYFHEFIGMSFNTQSFSTHLSKLQKLIKV